jgi:hypothetical protein
MHEMHLVIAFIIDPSWIKVRKEGRKVPAEESIKISMLAIINCLFN